MRQKRAKSYRKQMLVYNHTFKFREPYQVIVDEQIVLTCDQAKYDLAKGLGRTLQAEVKPMITQCCMQALYATNNQSAISMAKEFERRRCNHPPTAPLAPHECIKSIVVIKGKNKHRYVVASDNEKLRWSLRKIPGIPLIFMNRSVMVMEPLSKGSASVSNELEESKLTGGLNATGNDDNDESKPSKKRKLKEPNPLSVLKKKKKPEPKPEEKKKRKRKHRKGGDDDESGETAEGTEQGLKNTESSEAKDTESKESKESNDSESKEFNDSE